MVTFGGAKDSLYRGLRSLPRRPYLAAMWILCGELQVLYAPWTNDEVTSLMASTMDLVREAAISGESAEVAQRGLELARAWAPVIEAKDAEPGSPGNQGRDGADGTGRGPGRRGGRTAVHPADPVPALLDQ
jgi:hypothetical protein